MKNVKILAAFALMMTILLFSSFGSYGSKQPYGMAYENISYGKKECQTYDLHIPEGLDKSTPQGVILFVHGGSWIRGDKSSMTKFCEEYAKEGYITATLNYTLLSEEDKNTTLNSSLDDISLCISELKDDLERLGYRAKTLAISGNSAGGHLTLMYGLSRADESEIPIGFIFPRTGPSHMGLYAWEPVKAEKVAFFLSLFTGEEITEEMYLNGSCDDLISQLSPVTYIDENTVPMVLAYSGNDTVVGMNHYQVMKPYLDKYGISHQYVLFPESDHYLKDDPASYEEFKEKVLLYAEKYL